MNHKEITRIINETDWNRNMPLLTDWEKEFIGDLVDRPRSSYSEKMVDKILKIYNRCVR
jgi:hypothetical protein